jgi:hypothetical protein
VQFQIVGYQGVLEWTTRDGSIRRFEFFAAASLTLTNLQTGEVIRLAAGGPGHITRDTDGSFDFSGTGTRTTRTCCPHGTPSAPPEPNAPLRSWPPDDGP